MPFAPVFLCSILNNQTHRLALGKSQHSSRGPAGAGPGMHGRFEVVGPKKGPRRKTPLQSGLRNDFQCGFDLLFEGVLGDEFRRYLSYFRTAARPNIT